MFGWEDWECCGFWKGRTLVVIRIGHEGAYSADGASRAPENQLRDGDRGDLLDDYRALRTILDRPDDMMGGDGTDDIWQTGLGWPPFGSRSRLSLPLSTAFVLRLLAATISTVSIESRFTRPVSTSMLACGLVLQVERGD